MHAKYVEDYQQIAVLALPIYLKYKEEHAIEKLFIDCDEDDKFLYESNLDYIIDSLQGFIKDDFDDLMFDNPRREQEILSGLELMGNYMNQEIATAIYPVFKKYKKNRLSGSCMMYDSMYESILDYIEYSLQECIKGFNVYRKNIEETESDYYKEVCVGLHLFGIHLAGFWD